MENVKVDIISKQRIKPSSPTPKSLKNFKLSLLDQIQPPVYGLIIFFYSAEGDKIKPSCFTEHLKSSLSQTLTSFYPMAGRLPSDEGAVSIDCDDEGAIFVEASMDCDLSNVVSKPDAELLDRFLPTSYAETMEFASGCMSIIQLTRFQCGGVAISVCLYHKLFDVSSLVAFLHGWTSAARGSPLPPQPVFVQDSLLPSRESYNPFSQKLKLLQKPDNLKTKRFVFRSSKIASLKAEVGMIGEQYPSRIEVVSALILKSAMQSSRRQEAVVLHQAADLRRRMNPPLPNNSVGNLYWVVPVIIKERESDLRTLVMKMKEAMKEFGNIATKLRGEEGFSIIGEFFKKREEIKEMERYSCTCWCKFPLYETDLGFGKPVWVSSTNVAFKNTMVLVDTKQGDGIEAWVTLEATHMSLFEQNEALFMD